MSTESFRQGVWSRRRWLVAVLLVLVLQLGLILWLSDRAPIRARRAAGGPMLRLAGPGSAEMLALDDPTLFALPHRQGFSGPAWITTPRLPERSFSWSEEPRWLLLRVPELGAAFNRFVATNDFNALQTLAAPEPALALPGILPLAVSAGASALRIEGQLAQRRLLTPLTLPPWAHTNLLTNTVMQIVVDAAGRPVSLTPLSSSGYPPADQHALEQAGTARFNSLPDSSSQKPALPWEHLTWGNLIFEWHTVAETATNSSPPAANP
jgi:hypothetical protein